MQDAFPARPTNAKETVNRREFEAAILLKAALRLQRLQAHWDTAQDEVDEALTYNGNLWRLFLASICDATSPLPLDIRQTIANLGLFVTHQTRAMNADPRPERLSTLIGINRELAAGLLGRV